MESIRDIALKVWPEVCKSASVGETIAVKFAEALIAEVQRQNKPMAWHHPEEGLNYENHYCGNIPLFTFPPSLESEREKVAEACAAYVDRFIGGDGILNEAWVSDIAKAIRSGEWRRFVK